MKGFTLQYASNFFLNLHKRRDFQHMLNPCAENLAILGNICSVDTPINKEIYDSFLKYVSKAWKNVYIIPGPHEFSSNTKKPFYENYISLTEIKHAYKNIVILNNSNVNIPKTNITLVGSTLWVENPSCKDNYEFSKIYKYDKNGLRQMNNNDIKDWCHEDIYHIENSINISKKNIILSHFLPSPLLTNFTQSIFNESSDFEDLCSPPIKAWIGGAGSKTVSGIFGKSTFCSVNTYTQFHNPTIMNENYDSQAYMSLD